MNPRLKSLTDTKEFVHNNLTAIVKEYSDWQKTDKLPDGRFREAAQLLNAITSTGRYGKNDYVAGRLNIVTAIMFENLIGEHLTRAGFMGENI